MTKSSDLLSGNLTDDEAESWLTQLLAEENGRDRNMLWRLAGWGVAAVSALTLGIFATQFPFATLHLRDTANAELAARARQVEWVAQQSQMETRRLAAVVATISTNRERLNDRVNAIEQGLESVTGALSKPDAGSSSANQALPKTSTSDVNADLPALSAPGVQTVAPSTVAPVVSAPETSSRVSSVAAGAPLPQPETQTASVEAPAPFAATATPNNPAKSETEGPAAGRTEFGLELGGANSLAAARTLWANVQKDHAAELGQFRPIVTVSERGGLLGLHLVAGPIKNAADAAKICATLNAKHRECQTVPFEGQRLALQELPRKKPVRRKRVIASPQPVAVQLAPPVTRPSPR
jgi:hypothetical protein